MIEIMTRWPTSTVRAARAVAKRLQDEHGCTGADAGMLAMVRVVRGLEHVKLDAETMALTVRHYHGSALAALATGG